jgi:hypothetical protein
MIDWMNKNEGFIMGCLTFVSVGTTAIMAWLMTRSNNISSQSLTYAVELEDRRSRPYLIFDLEYSDHCIFAILKNIGLSPAVKIEIETDPQLLRSNAKGNREELGMIKFPPSQFLPGELRRDLIDGGPQFYKNYSGSILCGKLKYGDVSGKQYGGNFVIDLAFMLSLQDIHKPDISREVEKTRRALEKVASEMEKVRALLPSGKSEEV